MKEQSQSFEVNVSIEECSRILSDLPTFGRLHPLIRRVRLDKKHKNTYSVVEKPFAFIPINIRYTARLEVLDTHHLKYHITGLGLYKPILDYRLHNIGKNKTKVQCTIQIHERGPGRKYLLKRMFQAQDQLWEKAENP